MLLARHASEHTEIGTSRFVEVVDGTERRTMKLPPLLQSPGRLPGRLPVNRSHGGAQVVGSLNNVITAEQHDLLERPPSLPLGLRHLRDHLRIGPLAPSDAFPVLVEVHGKEDAGPYPVDVPPVRIKLPVVPPRQQFPPMPTALHHVVGQMRRQRTEQHRGDSD